MPIPDYQWFMGPLLEIASDGSTHKFGDVCNLLAKRLKLTDVEILQLLPSGRYPVFRSRVGWAKTYLTKACLLKIEGRGNFTITKRGLDAVVSKQVVDSKYLLQFPEFLVFQQKSSAVGSNDTSAGVPLPKQKIPENIVLEVKSPDELLQTAYQSLRQALADDLLEQVKAASPAFFEKLVIDLLVAMGYSGTGRGTARVTGRSGDGGVDGVIHEDRLGFGTIYV